MYVTPYCPLSQNISTRMNHWCPAWPTQYTNTPDPPAHFRTLHQRWTKQRKSTWTALRAPLLPPHLSIWTRPTRSPSPDSRSSAYRASTPRTAWTTQTTSRISAPWSSKHTPMATCRLLKMQNIWGWKCTSTLWRQVTVKMSHFTVDKDGKTSIYSGYAGKHFAELSDRYACRQGQNEHFITWATFQICLFCSELDLVGSNNCGSLQMSQVTMNDSRTWIPRRCQWKRAGVLKLHIMKQACRHTCKDCF